MDMNALLGADFGEKSSRIKTSFKRTIQIEQYNPETIQVDTEIEFEGHMTAIERDTIICVLQSTTEYQAQIHLYKKGLISSDEFIVTRGKLEKLCEDVLTKYEKLTGKSRDTILNRVDNMKENEDS